MFIKNENLKLANDATETLKQVINKIYDTRNSDFANGRTIRKIFDEVVRRKNSRVIKLPETERTKENLITIIKEDFNGLL